MFIVGAFNGTLTGGYAQAASYGAAAGGQSRSVGKSNGTATVDSREYSADVTSTSSWSTSTMLAFATFGASTESLAVNGSTAVSGTDTPNTPASTPFYVGSQGAANPWTGPIYEVLLYNGSLSIVEQQFIEGYLACKWALQGSLPSTHPYKSSCPLTATANLTIALSVSPPGIQVPGTDLTYTNTFTNASGTIVYAPALTATIPANTQFKVGTASQSLGSTGLAAVISYSNDSAATFTYTPASGGGGAAAGYDANVTTVRWSFSGALGPAASIDSGTAAYTVRIK
jgi:hypothetical protein